MRYLLDTNAVRYLLADRWAERAPEGEYHVSVTTELELLSYHRLSPEAEQELERFIVQSAVVDLLERVKSATIRLRRQHRLKLPDSIISATALVLNAVLLTADEKLLKLSEIRTRAVRLRT